MIKDFIKTVLHVNCLYSSLISVCNQVMLTHWGRVTHICVGKLTIIDSDNGLSPGRRQAIIWTIAGILLIVPLGTNFSEILTEILTFSFKKMRMKVLSAKRQPFCLGLNVLTDPEMLSSRWNFHHWLHWKLSFDDLGQDCSISLANALEILHPCSEP